MSYRIAFSQTGDVLVATISGTCPKPGTLAHEIGSHAREIAARHLVVDMRRLLDRAGRLRELFSHKSVPRRVAVIDSARNERLYRLIDQLRQDIQKTRILALRLPERLDYSMREHDQILDAFLKKNSQLAESAMVRHLTNHMKTLQKALDNLKGEKK